MSVRAEHASLREFLQTHLTAEELSSLGLLSFNQWGFTTAALAEVAITAHELGSTVAVGFWADETPLPDAGWATSHAISLLLRSPSLDQNAQRALEAAGLARKSFVRPPISRWSPVEPLAVPEPPTRLAIRSTMYCGSGMGRSILQVHPDFNTPIRDDLVWPRRYVERAMRSYAWVYDQTRALIRAKGIRTLIVYNGRFTHDRASAAAAEAEGIRVLYYDAGGLDTDFDLTPATTHDWDHLQTRMLDLWDKWTDDDRDEIARTWFLNRQNHDEPGLDVFVGLQEKGHVGALPDADLLVAFFSSSGDEIRELELDWADYLHSQEEAVMALGQACREQPGTRLVVRTHPHMRLKPADDLAEWTAAVDAAAPDVHFDPHSTVDSYALMRAADVVFTYGSTSGVEAAFLDRPVIVMGPSAYDRLGCARRITSAEQLPWCLDDPPPPAGGKALPYGLMMQRRGFNYERVTTNAGRTPSLAGIAIEEPSELVKKLSHLRRERLLRRLTRGISTR
jgi:hypothetical protein